MWEPVDSFDNGEEEQAVWLAKNLHGTIAAQLVHQQSEATAEQ